MWLSLETYRMSGANQDADPDPAIKLWMSRDLSITLVLRTRSVNFQIRSVTNSSEFLL